MRRSALLLVAACGHGAPGPSSPAPSAVAASSDADASTAGTAFVTDGPAGRISMVPVTK